MKFTDLEGRWKIHRKVHNSVGKVSNLMEGLGNFLKTDKNELIYQEQLYHQIKGEKVVLATKFYRYLFERSSISIFFHKEENNRLFLVLPCSNDKYKLNWSWINSKRFFMCYSVLGPKKNYLIKSRYIKL